ncbi:hypothetical protein BKA64DRAFT_81725 [Cadophora sp. MPI-SDFR-AT-0126]|nr:hypothetical protein BKA64DRAFT_81725 [Leotiomycetes sp. MPI-SDFR-AT-0126]
MDPFLTRNPKVRTACDSCYKLKERCQRESISAACARCERLSLSCLTVRPARPCGRRVQHGRKDRIFRKSPGPRKTLHHAQLSTEGYLSTLLDLQPGEKELLHFLLNQPESLTHFIMYSDFQGVQQSTLAGQLPAASPILKDAYLAWAMTIKQLQCSQSIDMTTCVSYISKAISTLRSLPVLTSQDAFLCNTLGGILAFSIYSAIGVGASDICTFCLGATDSFVESEVPEVQDDPWQSYLVLLETADCLVYRRKPTRTIQRSTSIIDSRLGLCVPLLTYYHDLAVISNLLVTATDLGILARLLKKQLDSIYATLESWQPSNLEQLTKQFNSSDVVNLLAQAKVYRLGALLVAHRLQYPFGCEDAKGEIWSKEVMMELEMAKLVTKSPLRFVTLPFIVAAVEVRDESMRLKTVQHVDDYVDHYAPFLRKATKKFLSRVWRERDTNLTTRWFDSIHKPCPVMESIDATCFGNSCVQSNTFQRHDKVTC